MKGDIKGCPKGGIQGGLRAASTKLRAAWVAQSPYFFTDVQFRHFS
jgi:hypothetical protein